MTLTIAREQAQEGAPAGEKVAAQKIREFGQSAGRVLHRGRRRDARRAADRTARGEDRPAACDGRGARRHPARSDALRRDRCPTLQRCDLPRRRHPLHRRGGQSRADLLHVPGRSGDRPDAAQGPDLADCGDLQHRRRDPDDRGPRGRAADLRARRPGQRLHGLRALHGRVDVDHRLPGARPHPRRAAHAQAADRGARARERGDRRHLRLVPDRAGDRGRGRRLGLEVVRTIALAVVFCGVMVFGARKLLARASDRLRRGRARAGRVGRGDLRRRAAVGLRDRADRHRAHLRRVRDGRGHAAARGPDRGRHAPDRGLRRPPAAAAVLLLHRPAHERRS